MRKYLVLAALLIFIAPGYSVASEDEKMEETGMMHETEEMHETEPSSFTVGRFVVAEGVEDREPTGIADTFSAFTEKVYGYLEATEIAEDTEAYFVWYRQGTEVARVRVPVGRGPRWRTYSSKELGGEIGEWVVEVQDAGSTVLSSVTFKVEAGEVESGEEEAGEVESREEESSEEGH